MLLRSASTPILCIPHSSAVADSSHRSSSKPISRTASAHNKMQRTPSDGNMRQTAVPKKQRPSPMGTIRPIGSHESFKEGSTDNIGLSTLSLAGAGAGGDVASKGGATQGFGDYGEGKQMMDDYYQNMIKTYPGETLLLANYAKFLKEVQGDSLKAEEYCERAVLVEPDDGEVLSMYGDLIWTNHRDEAKAQSYFDRAVQVSPNNCHVNASYARYLWNAEEEEEQHEGKGQEHQINGTNTCTPHPHGPTRFTAAAY